MRARLWLANVVPAPADRAEASPSHPGRLWQALQPGPRSGRPRSIGRPGVEKNRGIHAWAASREAEPDRKYRTKGWPGQRRDANV